MGCHILHKNWRSSKQKFDLFLVATMTKEQPCRETNVASSLHFPQSIGLAEKREQIMKHILMKNED